MGRRGIDFGRELQTRLLNVHRAKDIDDRPLKSLEGKWPQIRKDTTSFSGAFTAFAGLDDSRTSEDHRIEKALAVYKAKHPKAQRFFPIDCLQTLYHFSRWAELRQAMKKATPPVPGWADLPQAMKKATLLVPVWPDLPQATKKATPLFDITNGNEVSSMGLGRNTPNAPGESQSSGNLSNEEAPGLGRPIGSRKAKDQVKRQKILDDSLVMQARAAFELTSTIMEKVSLMKEQSMMALIPFKDGNGLIFADGREFFAVKRSRDTAAEDSEVSRQQQQGFTPPNCVPSQATTTETPSTDGDHPNFTRMSS